MDPLTLYILASVLYIMVIHFAIGKALSKEFNTFFMAAIFALGGLIGWYLESYATGFVFAAVFTMLFW